MATARSRLRWPLLLCASVGLCGDGGGLPAACYDTSPGPEFTDPTTALCLSVEVGGAPSPIPCRFTWRQRYSDGARVVELDGTNAGRSGAALTFAARFELEPGAPSGVADATGLVGLREASAWALDGTGLRYVLGSFVPAGSQDAAWYGSGTVQLPFTDLPLHGSAHLVLDPFSEAPGYQPGPPGTTLAVDVTF